MTDFMIVKPAPELLQNSAYSCDHLLLGSLLGSISEKIHANLKANRVLFLVQFAVVSIITLSFKLR